MGKVQCTVLDAEIPEGHDGPLRLCAATRTQRPLDDLIRFVASPEGDIVPDLARSLPGRGVWVSADARTLDEAIRTKVFARSLKQHVRVSDELAGIVTGLLERRACQSLALANKAGGVITGFQKIDAALEPGNVAALVHGCDAAADGCHKLDRKYLAISLACGVPATIVRELTIEQMSLAIGRPNVVHAALIKGGATKKFLSDAGRLARFRAGLPAAAEDHTSRSARNERKTHVGNEGA